MDKAAFEAHPIWNVLSSLEAAIEGASERGEPAAAAQLERLRYLAALVKSHTDPSDVGPYSSAALNAVQSPLSSVAAEVSNFVSNGNVGHLNNAENQADQVLLQIGSWPTGILRGGAAAQANKVFEQYRDAAQAALAKLAEENALLRQTSASQQAAAEKALAALQQDVAALSAKITADEGRLDTALTTSNEAFTAKQTEREAKFSEWLEAQGKALKALGRGSLIQRCWADLLLTCPESANSPMVSGSGSSR